MMKDVCKNIQREFIIIKVTSFKLPTAWGFISSAEISNLLNRSNYDLREFESSYSRFQHFVKQVILQRQVILDLNSKKMIIEKTQNRLNPNVVGSFI